MTMKDPGKAKRGHKAERDLDACQQFIRLQTQRAELRQILKERGTCQCLSFLNCGIGMSASSLPLAGADSLPPAPFQPPASKQFMSPIGASAPTVDGFS